MQMKIFVALVYASVIAIAFAIQRWRSYDDTQQLVDWSEPRPFPIFIGVNVLASLLRRTADYLTPAPVRMMDIAMMYHVTALADVCQKFTIPDYLATGPKTVEQIAAHMQTADVQRVERLMYALAAEGMTKLVVVAGKTEPSALLFVNTALSATLRIDHPNSVRGWIGHNMDDVYPLFGLLPKMFGPAALDNVWDAVYPDSPLSDGGIWTLFAKHPEREEQFGRAMAGIESLGGKAMARDGPFAKFDRFVDIGGSLGHFLHKLLALHPKKEGVLFDRQPVLENARKLWHDPKGDYYDAHDRMSIIPGNFFDVQTFPQIREGDALYMRHILHDWDDKSCIRILTNIRYTIGDKNATLLIGEVAMPNRDRVAQASFIQELDMQMMAIFGSGIERTPAMFEDLFAQTGFQLKAIHPTRSVVHWVEAIPI